jgi:hypothetical protein
MIYFAHYITIIAKMEVVIYNNNVKYCNAGGASVPALNLREVNLELGRPSADAAIKRLTYEIHTSRRLGASVLKIIQGSGSSGAGGRIRVEARAYLERLARRGEIKGFIEGERFSIFDEETRLAFRNCDALRDDRDLDRHNNGVTFILL